MCLEEQIKIIKLAQKAVFLYDKQVLSEKRRLLEFVCSNSTYVDGKLTVEYRKPFDLLADMNVKHQRIFQVSSFENQSIQLGGLISTVLEPFLEDFRVFVTSPTFEDKATLVAVQGFAPVQRMLS